MPGVAGVARDGAAVRPPSPAGDRALLELHLGDMRQLFNSMDPAPFRERDLDPKASDYIVDWADEIPKAQPLAMLVRISQQPVAPGDEALLGDAVHKFYKGRAAAKRREVSQLFRVGRISLLIGFVFMGLMMLAGQAAYSLFSHEAYAALIKESLIISGWVALWRPAEIFLHEWWPILGEARLYDRLAIMPVSLLGADAPVGHAG
jgi:hypothetical protein